MEGYIKLHRKLIESAVWAHPVALKIWLWCLIKARRKTGYVPIKIGRGTEIVKLIEGQFIYGRSKVDEVGINKETIRYWLEKFASDDFSMITINSTNHYSIITICNWDAYQNEITEELPANYQAITEQPPADYQAITEQLPADSQPITEQLPADSQPNTTNKNDNKDKNDDNLKKDKVGNSEAASAGSGSVEKKDFSKGKEKNTTTRIKRGRPSAEIELFDPWLEQEEFRAAWACWLAMRREKHKPVSVNVQKDCLAQLKTITDDISTATTSVTTTARNGWNSFFIQSQRNTTSKISTKNEYYNADTVNGTEPDFSITR